MAPEGVGDEGWSVQTLLTTNPEDEEGENEERDDEEGDVGWRADCLGAAGDGSVSVSCWG